MKALTNFMNTCPVTGGLCLNPFCAFGCIEEKTDLKERYRDNLKKKHPLSFINISRLCYGDKIIEKHLAKNN